MLQVLAVGDVHDPLMAYAYNTAVPTTELRKVQADSPAELMQALSVVVAEERRPIDVLDIFDHGSPGTQFFGRAGDHGRPVLFKSDGDLSTPLDGDPSPLDGFLSRHALLRLLGCETAGTSNATFAVAADARGRALILKLAHALGAQRTVLATLVPVIASMFEPRGFRDGPAREYLYSSHAALDGPAPLDRRASIARLKADGFPPH